MSLFQIVGNSLVGAGLSFDVATLVRPCPCLSPRLEDAPLEPQLPADPADPAEGQKIALAAIVDIANVIYREARATTLPSYDDRYELHLAVETLRALAVIVGPITGERHRRAADIIARMLQEAGA